jgi:tetratricopeptide (TPR) repeat protein
MELLKKSFTLLLLAIAVSTYAQDNTLMNAFSKSYGFEANKKYEDAINSLKAVYNAGSYETNLRLGWLNYCAEKYKESVVYYQKAISLMPAATEPIWGIINPLVVLEQWNDVEKYYQIILKLDSKNSVANYHLGLIYYYRKNYTTAKKYFDVSLNLYPFDYNNLLMSGWNNYFLGNTNEARSIFNKVLLYKPNDSSALEGLGLIK